MYYKMYYIARFALLVAAFFAGQPIALADVTVPSSATAIYNAQDYVRNKLYRVGSIYLGDTGSHTMELRAPATLADDNYVFVLPGADGDPGQVLGTDGLGNLSWQSASDPTAAETLTNKTIDAGDNTILNLTDAEVATGADIDRAKLAAGTADHVLINDASGVMTSEATLSKSRGGAGADMSSVTFPSTGVLVTEDGTQTLTSKTLDAPAVSNYVELTETTTTPATPSAGSLLLYGKDDSSLYVLDSLGNERQVGSGASGDGLDNQIENARAEDPTIPASFITYDDGSVEEPIDCTGGTASAIQAWTRSTSSPIQGDASWLLQKDDAEDAQGQGWAIEFTVPADHPMASSYYAAFNFDFKFSDSDGPGVRIYVYDVTNSTMITPSFVSGGGGDTPTLTPVTSSTSRAQLGFQTTNGTSYRICVHNADADTDGYSLKVDGLLATTEGGVQVGPDSQFLGELDLSIQNGGSKTYTIQNRAWRHNNLLRVKIGVTGDSTAAGAGSGAWMITLPPGYTIDPNGLATGSYVGGSKNTVGFVTTYGLIASGTFGYGTGFYVVGSNTLGLIKPNTNLQYRQDDFNVANGIEVEGFFEVPIAEWAGSSSSAVTVQSSPVRAGTIMAWAGSAAPEGWQLCDGTELSQSTYYELYQVIGSTYDTATDTTTGSAHPAPSAGNFRVPDLRGVFLRGVGTPSGLSAVTLGGFQADEFKKHQHYMSLSIDSTPTSAATIEYGLGDKTADSYADNVPTDRVTGGVGGTETRPRNVGVNYIIKLYNDRLDIRTFGAASSTAPGLVSYEDSGTFSISFTGARSITFDAAYSRVGKTVTISFPEDNSATCSAAGFIGAAGTVPVSLRPGRIQRQSIWVKDNGIPQTTAGEIEFNTDGSIVISKNITTGSFTASAACGWYGTSFTYTVN